MGSETNEGLFDKENNYPPNTEEESIIKREDLLIWSHYHGTDEDDESFVPETELPNESKIGYIREFELALFLLK